MKTTFFQILPALVLSLFIFFWIATLYYDRLKPGDKIILLIHFIAFTLLLIIIAVKFLENLPWAQTIWIFAYVGLNTFSWIAHLATPKQEKNNEQLTTTTEKGVSH